MNTQKRYRVTISRFVWAINDLDVTNQIRKELGEENAKCDSHPNLVSIQEIPFGTMNPREIEIL